MPKAKSHVNDAAGDGSPRYEMDYAADGVFVPLPGGLYFCLGRKQPFTENTIEFVKIKSIGSTVVKGKWCNDPQYEYIEIVCAVANRNDGTVVGDDTFVVEYVLDRTPGSTAVMHPAIPAFARFLDLAKKE